MTKNLFLFLTILALGACSVESAKIKTDPVKPQPQAKLESLYGTFDGDRLTAFLWPTDQSKLQNAVKVVTQNSDKVDKLEAQKLKADQDVYEKNQEKKRIEASACKDIEPASAECQQARFDQTRAIAAEIEVLQSKADALFAEIGSLAIEVEDAVGVESDGFKNFMTVESLGNVITISPEAVTIDFSGFGASQQSYSSSNPQEIDEISFDTVAKVLKFRLIEKDSNGAPTGNHFRFDLERIPLLGVKVRFVGKLYYTVQGVEKVREGAAKIDGYLTAE